LALGLAGWPTEAPLEALDLEEPEPILAECGSQGLKQCR
jgi:hypothetical protein